MNCFRGIGATEPRKSIRLPELTAPGSSPDAYALTAGYRFAKVKLQRLSDHQNLALGKNCICSLFKISLHWPFCLRQRTLRPALDLK
jgi:hypothetical protein